MAGTKFSDLTAVAAALGSHEYALNEAGTSKKITGAQIRAGLPINNASTGNQTGFAADQYLTSSVLTAEAGAWKLGTICRWRFDMVKTAAGTAALIITVRLGTNGSIGDAAIYTFTFAVGTAAIDTGIFDVEVLFRSIGGGTAAVVAGITQITHHLAATGLTTTGASGVGIILPGASAGFDSTTQTKIGLSVNGGASFAGTNTYVAARADKL